MVTWTSPWREDVQGEHVCTVKELVTEQRLQVLITRMIPCADAVLDEVEELKEMVTRIQGQ